MTATTRRKIEFEHDPEPDHSWLEQECFTSQPDADYYCNPENHVTLAMVVYELCDDDEDWRVVDSLCGIDFMADSDEYQTGTFYHVSHLPEGYLRELAREAGLPE